jgi:hypothetical protein
MRRFATSDLTPGASIAVLTLEWEGSGGIEVLRELYEEDLVTEPRARFRLQELAKARGWGKLDRSVQNVGAGIQRVLGTSRSSGRFRLRR